MGEERYMLSALAVTTAALHQRLENATRKNGYHLHLKEVRNLAENPLEVPSATGSTEIVAMFGIYYGMRKQCSELCLMMRCRGGGTGGNDCVPGSPVENIPALAYDEPVHKMPDTRHFIWNRCCIMVATGGAGLGRQQDFPFLTG